MLFNSLCKKKHPRSTQITQSKRNETRACEGGIKKLITRHKSRRTLSLRNPICHLSLSLSRLFISQLRLSLRRAHTHTRTSWNEGIFSLREATTNRIRRSWFFLSAGEFLSPLIDSTRDLTPNRIKAFALGEINGAEWKIWSLQQQKKRYIVWMCAPTLDLLYFGFQLAYLSQRLISRRPRREEKYALWNSFCVPKLTHITDFGVLWIQLRSESRKSTQQAFHSCFQQHAILWLFI